MKVSEIFYSFSGEGKSTGELAVFIRLQGCNFHDNPCKYPCDTGYALSPDGGKEVGISGVMAKLIHYPARLIVITGGEPLWQKDTQKLANTLSSGYQVEIITNGSLPIWDKFEGVWSVDIKCPSSGNDDKNIYNNLKKLRERDQIKFVIANYDDFLFAKNIVKAFPCKATKLFQPAWKPTSEGVSTMIDWVKNEAPWGRISLQTHKHIYGASRRGV